MSVRGALISLRAMTALALVRFVHIAAGALALASLWLPLVTQKGGPLHRRSGWVYVVATAVVSVTGGVLAVSYLFDGRSDNDAAGLFLLYVGLLGATSASMGIRVLGTKRRIATHRNPYDLGLPLLLLVGGAALGVYGLTHGSALFVVFASLGMFLAVGQLRFWTRPPATRMEWWYQHMSGMGGSCITTVTAFLVVNARRLGLGPFDLVVWTAPGVIGSVALMLWQRRYRTRFERADRVATPAS